MARSDRRRFALVLLAGAFGSAACAGLTGISNYEKVECSGSECDAGTLPDVNRPDVVTSVDAAGAKPVSWAKFRMPNYPQDGGPDANLASYEPASNTVRDRVTALVWERSAAAEARSYDEAERYCANLRLDGATWRVPSRIELVTLLDLRTIAGVDTAFFAGPQGDYWTSSEVRPYPASGQRWSVSFSRASAVVPVDEKGSAFVRCVKGA